MTRGTPGGYGLVLTVALLAVGGWGSAAATPTPGEPRPLFRIEDERIGESSGVTASSDGEVIFTLQDATKPASVYAIDLTGQTRLTIDLPGNLNEDWEDIDRGVDEQGRPTIFVADLGDAFFVRRMTGEPPRTEFSIVRFREPAVPLNAPAATVEAEDLVVYPVVYEDGAARNSEAMAVHPSTGRIFVVDKIEDPADTAHLWVAPEELSAAEPNVLTKVAQIPVAEATAAAFSPDGELFVVRDYRTAYVWAVPGGDLAVALRQRPRSIQLPPQPQGEGLAFTHDGSALLLTSEGADSLVWEVPLLRDEVGATAAPAERAEGATADPDHRVAVAVGAAAGVGALALGLLEVRSARRRHH